MGLVIDNFAGGGGTSTGIELAIGRSPDIAINHDEAAIRMHKTNHPETKHFQENVWDIDIKTTIEGQQVDLAWFSPDCKHFSKAKGGKPLEKKIRGLAWIVLKWAGIAKPRVIILENVEEFESWGPLKKGRPIQKKKGETFNKWKGQLQSLGYEVEHRQLKACDYGAPTNRKRFFLIARCDGQPIVWPEPTHAPKESIEVMFGIKKPYVSASHIIDWTISGQSIFERKSPVAENSLKRIAKGLEKFVGTAEHPFIREANGELMSAFISKSYAGESRSVASSMDDCVHTITARPCFGLVEVILGEKTNNDVKEFIQTYYGKSVFGDKSGKAKDLLPKGETLKVTVKGKTFEIEDIRMRSLTPRELFAAQGFPPEYIIDKDYTGKDYKKDQQIARCGNAVPPLFSKVLVEANCQWLCARDILQVV